MSKIRELRKRSGLDTTLACEKLRISKSMLYKIETGYRTPSAELIARMAKVYSCTTDEIFKDFKITG